ncbi:MAG: S1C family serine protease [Gaiellaceae bacterium]
MTRRRALIASAAALAGVAALLLGAQRVAASGDRSAASIDDGIVDITTNLAYQNAAAAGTGMVLTSSGEVLTNNHVIRGATTIRVTDPSTGRKYSATVVGYDLAADVAVLQLKNATGLRTVSLGDSSKVKVGQAVTALGNAGGTGGIPVAATGTITGLGRSITASDGGTSERLTGLIETDAGVEPGDSGGPLVDAAGKVIGMDTAASAGFAFESGGNDAYAIPINRALTIAKQIEAGRSATAHIGATAFLGIEVAAVDAFMRGQTVNGAVVAGVVHASPAERAGLVYGDVIIALNNHRIASPTTLTALLQKQSPGAKVRIRWIDSFGTSHTVHVTLASGPAQ